MSATAADLPRVTPTFDAIAITNTSVLVSSGGDINAAISTAIATNKRRVLLAPGGTYTGPVTLPSHGFSDWMELAVNATMPALGTRLQRTTSLGFTLPKIFGPMGSPALAVGASARRWRVRGIDITSDATLGYTGGDGDTHAIVQTCPDTVASIEEVPAYISIRQCLVGGAEETHHGTKNRRAGITMNASMLEVCDCTIYNINYGGLRYDIQSQSGGQFAGFGRLRIENNNVWGSTEGLAWGGTSQFPALANDSITLADITIRKNHIYRPESVFAYQGVANGLEFKLGRRILIEGNTIENVPQQLQNGLGFLFWTADQNAENPYVQGCDVTVRYNWFKNCSGICSSNALWSGAPGLKVTRLTFQDNVCTGQGCGSIPAYRTLELDSRLTDYLYEHNLFINTGGETWCVCDFAQFTRPTFRNNILGTTFSGSNILFTSGGANQAAWNQMNAGGDGEWANNAILAPGGQTINPGTNTHYTTLASMGFADASKLSDTTTTFAQMVSAIVNTTGQGPDIAAVSAMLTGVEMSSAERALYVT